MTPAIKQWYLIAFEWQCNCPSESCYVATVQLSKNVITDMGGEGKPLFHKTWDFLIFAPEENYYTLNFLKVDTIMWGWKTRVILKKWPDIKLDKLGRSSLKQ